MLWQVLLPQVAGETDDPGILTLSNVGKNPDVRRAHHVKLVADGRGAPLCQCLEIDPTWAVEQVCLKRRTAFKKKKKIIFIPPDMFLPGQEKNLKIFIPDQLLLDE